ncbi:MAG: RNA polymerase sigma factor [Planctomycetota bacterium]
MQNEKAKTGISNSAETAIASAGAAFDEKSVIARAQKGNRDAFTLIVRQYQDRLYNVILRMVNSEEDALDVCQDVFIKVFGSIGSFKGDSSFLTYLYRIAFNESVMYRNKRKRMIPVDFKCNPHCAVNEAMARNNANHVENIQAEDSNKYIRRVLDSLEPKAKEVVVLNDIEGLSYDEIGRTLGISVSQVRTILADARAVLKEKLKDFL